MGSIHANTISMTHQSGKFRGSFRQTKHSAHGQSGFVGQSLLLGWSPAISGVHPGIMGIKPTLSQVPKVGPAKKMFFSGDCEPPATSASLSSPQWHQAISGSGLNPRTYVIGRAVCGCGGLGCWHQRSRRVAEIPLLAVRDGDLTEGFVFFWFFVFFLCVGCRTRCMTYKDVCVQIMHTICYLPSMPLARTHFFHPKTHLPALDHGKIPGKLYEQRLLFG